jgi:hypothetical protein
MIELPRACCGRRDRRDRRVLLLRHQRSDPDDASASAATTRLVPRLLYAKGILPVDPFVTVDQERRRRTGEARVERGRKTRPDIKLGICGEHGGDPASILLREIGLDYVSCSPYPRADRAARGRAGGARPQSTQRSALAVPSLDRLLGVAVEALIVLADVRLDPAGLELQQDMGLLGRLGADRCRPPRRRDGSVPASADRTAKAPSRSRCRNCADPRIADTGRHRRRSPPGTRRSRACLRPSELAASAERLIAKPPPPAVLRQIEQ